MKLSCRYAVALTCLLSFDMAAAQFAVGHIVAPCNSSIFCYGPLLRDVQLAEPFEDSKTFVDLPTIKPAAQVLKAYEQLRKPLTNDSALQSFLAENFGQVGLELAELNKTLLTNARFLEHVKSPIVRDFVRQVIGIWPLLSRVARNETKCSGCESSFISLKRPFVVAGGRFREVYYWDSYFILEGLLRTGGDYTALAKNTIENFLDLIEAYGFVPNGSRKYYLNRSQPPLLCDMIHIYIQHTNDTSILKRALPLLELEQTYWEKQTTNVPGRQSKEDQQERLFRYSVLNNQPRPESYSEDHETAKNRTYFASDGSFYSAVPLNQTASADLYANLASGAESGWDYGSRWLLDSSRASEDQGVSLRSLNTNNFVPVDLQAIQYSNAKRLGAFYALIHDESKSRAWQKIAEARASLIHTTHYNAVLRAYFDFNLTSGAQNILIPNAAANSTPQQIFSPSQFYALAFNASLPEIMKNSSLVLELYTPVVDQLSKYPGGVAATNLVTGQQWDSPNVWAPLQYFLIKGLLNTVSAIPADDPFRTRIHDLAVQIAQRFTDSAYCTWRSTGGEHPLLNIGQLSTATPSSNGTIFEKYSNLAIDAAGGGGEYSVVPGFGWTNGVLIWMADTFGEELQTPVCTSPASDQFKIRGFTEGHGVQVFYSPLERN